jgi:hypothetical protein
MARRYGRPEGSWSGLRRTLDRPPNRRTSATRGVVTRKSLWAMW